MEAMHRYTNVVGGTGQHEYCEKSQGPFRLEEQYITGRLV